MTSPSFRPDPLGQLVDVKSSLSARPLVELIRSLPAEMAELERGASDPARAEALVSYLLGLAGSRGFIHPLAEAGVLGTDGFVSGFLRRVTQRILPPSHPGQSLEELLRYAFAGAEEQRWLLAADAEAVARVLRTADVDGVLATAIRSAESTRIALRLLSYRIASVGLESELSSRLGHLDEMRTPFVALVEAVDAAIDGQGAPDLVDAVEEAIRACTREVRLLRMRGGTHGTSLRLTMLTTRLLQQLRRARLLLRCLAAEEDVYEAAATLGLEVARGAQTDRLVAPYLRETTRLVAFYLSHHSAERGEHYIAHGRLGWRNLLLASLLGGIWVAPFALGKLGLSKLPAAPLWMGLLFGLNYAICFMGMSVTGAALATKQPAVTAAATARAMEADGRSMERLAAFVVRVCRSQFASFVGNLGAAIPLGFVLVMSLGYAGAVPVDTAKAQAILHDLNPLDGREIVFAALAGVYLSLSGLVAAYVDNSMLFGRFARRLRWQRLVRRMSPTQRQRLVAFTTQKGGLLVGNLTLGLLLGAAPIIGEFTGLGIDIRHVAFSSAQLGAAIAAGGVPSVGVVVLAAFGVLVIGTVNFVVSFGLTLVTAMYAQRVAPRQGAPLLRQLLRHLAARPQDFVFPPKDEPDKAEEPAAPSTDGPPSGGAIVRLPPQRA